MSSPVLLIWCSNCLNKSGLLLVHGRKVNCCPTQRKEISTHFCMHELSDTHDNLVLLWLTGKTMPSLLPSEHGKFCSLRQSIEQDLFLQLNIVHLTPHLTLFKYVWCTLFVFLFAFHCCTIHFWDLLLDFHIFYIRLHYLYFMFQLIPVSLFMTLISMSTFRPLLKSRTMHHASNLQTLDTDGKFIHLYSCFISRQDCIDNPWKTGWIVEYALDAPCMHIFTTRANLNQPIHLLLCFQKLDRKPSHRAPRQ